MSDNQDQPRVVADDPLAVIALPERSPLRGVTISADDYALAAAIRAGRDVRVGHE